MGRASAGSDRERCDASTQTGRPHWRGRLATAACRHGTERSKPDFELRSHLPGRTGTWWRAPQNASLHPPGPRAHPCSSSSDAPRSFGSMRAVETPHWPEAEPQAAPARKGEPTRCPKTAAQCTYPNRKSMRLAIQKYRRLPPWIPYIDRSGFAEWQTTRRNHLGRARCILGTEARSGFRYQSLKRYGRSLSQSGIGFNECHLRRGAFPELSILEVRSRLLVETKSILVT